MVARRMLLGRVRGTEAMMRHADGAKGADLARAVRN
jgi:hypothetical protein